MKQYKVMEGLDALETCIESLKDAKGRLFVLYVGNVDDSTGESWCSDCNLAFPVLMKNALAILSEEDVLITCGVGNREMWKNNEENEFRVKKGLTAVPTLVELNTDRVLIEEDCSDKHLVPMMFRGQYK